MRGPERRETSPVGSLAPALSLLAVAVVSDVVFSLPGPLTNLMGVACVIAIAWAVHAMASVDLRERDRLRAAVTMVVGAVVAGVLLVLTHGAAKVFVIALLLCWLELSRRGAGR